ncbi:MAG: anthranilate synthase component I family protein [Thermoleophilia bacterium]|nr:anthranilate synthase component I family protein [Thermoleophilia bacterium]
MGELLEIWEAEGAFTRLEGWLRERGFFVPGGEALVAEVFLGYGLSATTRRDTVAAPREPCDALPLAAARIVDAPPRPLRPSRSGRARVGPWERTWTDGEYCAAIEAVRAAIARGDVYQVNLVQHLSAPFAGDAVAVADALRDLCPLHPRPFVGSGWAVVSASPELFLARRGRVVRTMPIKGTRPRGGARELAASAKDAAEHLMIVDLERNDLSRVCEAGSVRWPELMVTRELAGVAHMVSTVEGRLREGVGLAELLEATFPGGSVTGAPKIAAVDLIAALEPVGRGASMGALGYVYGTGDLELALTIRTLAIAEGRIHLWVGGGIVWDSEPEVEVAESWTKAAPLLALLGADVAVGAAR